ncbi:hypothetical protein FGB62_290g04 [Gracilaria domingensis]|nr:hypothetical protein FGB62_290g04 [Gracilaria domingensis]
MSPIRRDFSCSLRSSHCLRRQSDINMGMQRVWFWALLGAQLSALCSSVRIEPANAALNPHSSADDISYGSQHSYKALGVRSSLDAKYQNFLQSVSQISRALVRQNGAGLTGSPCSTLSDCAQPRRCLDVLQVQGNVNAAVECSPPSDSCLCLSFRSCASDRDCDDGEQCIAKAQFCASTKVIQVQDIQTIADSGQNAGSRVYGLTADACSTDSDCVGARQCLGARGDNNLRCDASFYICVCLPATVVFCASNSECVAGEVCQLPADGPATACFSDKVDFRAAAQISNVFPALLSTAGSDNGNGDGNGGDSGENSSNDADNGGIADDDRDETESGNGDGNGGGSGENSSNDADNGGNADDERDETESGACKGVVRRKQQLRHCGTHGSVQGAADDDEDVLRLARVQRKEDVREQPSFSPRVAGGVPH